MGKTCFDRFNRIMEITKFMAAVCGGNILNPNFKVNLHTWCVIHIINLFICFTIYIVYVGLFVTGDWKVVLQCLSVVGSALQGYSKLLTGIFRKSVVCSLFEKLYGVYSEYEADVDYKPFIRYQIDLTTKMLKIVMIIYIITVVSIVAYPLIYGAVHGEKLLIMQFILPGLDPASDNGYLVHCCFHSLCMFLGGFGNFAGDMIIFVSITHVVLLKDVLKVKCEKLNRITLTKMDPKKTIPLLKDILIWHQHYNTYIQEVEEVYYAVIFVQIFTSVVSICGTLFSIIVKSWPAAFVYLTYSVIALYAYCGLGNLVEITNDAIIDIIYGNIVWYDLTVPEQKQVLLMLRKSQYQKTLTVGHIMPLSMNTALQLTKAIYSYMMMLVNFLDDV